MGNAAKEMVEKNKLIVLDKMKWFTEINGYVPSVRELQLLCGFKSSSTAYAYLRRLQGKEQPMGKRCLLKKIKGWRDFEYYR